MRVRVERPRRLLLLVGAVALIVAAGSTVAWVAAADHGEAEDLLPNLTQAPPDDLSGRTGGTPQSRGSSSASSPPPRTSASGPLIVLGRRPNVRAGGDGASAADPAQRRLGRTVPLRSTLRYVRSSDHSHWHMLAFMRYELRSTDGARSRRDRKTGFCLGDRYRPSSESFNREPTARFSDRCGKERRGFDDP